MIKDLIDENHVFELKLSLIEKIRTLRDQIYFYQANWVKSEVKSKKRKEFFFPGFPEEKNSFLSQLFFFCLFYIFAIFLYF